MAAKAQLRVGDRLITVSNLDKVLYPDGNFTKQDVFSYYAHIAPVLLPHLRQRPITLKRFPDGVLGKAFYEKNAPAFTPDWIETFPVPRRERPNHPIRYILANDLPTLTWMANLACLELHPFLHCAPAIHRPTAVAFDLDPGEGANILDCAEVGFWLQELLSPLGLECFPKVSGSKGLQVYVPLNGQTSYPATQGFARAVAKLLSHEHPEHVVDQMAKALRKGKVFIDWSQNTDHKTTIAVYSLRAKNERPFVSAPVTWDELKRAMRKSDPQSLYFEPAEALSRVKKLGDLFQPVLDLKQRLPAGFARSTADPDLHASRLSSQKGDSWNGATGSKPTRHAEMGKRRPTDRNSPATRSARLRSDRVAPPSERGKSQRRRR